MAKKFDDNLFEDVAYSEPEMQDDLFEDVEYGAKEPETSATEAALRGAGQGLTFDTLDELIAAFKTSKGLSPRQEMTMPIEDVRAASKAETEAYEEEVAKQRAAFEKAREDQPVAYYGSEIGAGILPALLTGGATAAAKVGKEVVKGGVRGLAKGEGLKQAAKVGAGYGAASGFGASEADSLPELAGDVATGAALGAGLGTAMPIAGKALKEAGKVAMKPIKTIGEKFPSVKTGFQFGEKYGLASDKKINELMYDNTRELITVMSKSFQKLGLQKDAAQAKAMELGKRYDVTEGIQDVADQFRKQSEALLPADAKQAQKIAADIEEGFLKVDVKRQELLDKVSKEIQKKVERSDNLQKKAIQKGESAAVKEAEKSGASLEQLSDIKKRFEEVSDLPYDTKGGRIAGQEAKFKDEYMNLEGEMAPYEYRKKYLQDTTPFQPSKVAMGEVDDKLIAQYRDEATGEVFTKTGPKSQFIDKDFSNLTLEELSDLTSEYGKKGFDEKDPVYKELYKVVRNKLEEAGLDIPENKKEMFNLFQTMSVLGIDKAKLKYPSTEDVLKLTKKIPGKMDLEKDILQRDILGRDTDLSKQLDELKLLSEAKKYLGEGYKSATGEFTRAGAIQKGVSSTTDILGAAYGKVSRPVNNVANKVSQMTDEGLQYVSKSFNESNNAGIQAMGRQLEEALKQEGPVKSALIWSLSQNPAFRKQIEKALPKLDKGLEKDLGIEQDMSPETENLPEGGILEEVMSERVTEPNREPDSIASDDEAKKFIEDTVISQHERGYQKLKQDKGNYVTQNGKLELIGTNFGISAPVLRKTLGRDITQDDMKNLTKEEAKSILFDQFYKAPKIDQLDEDKRDLVLDFYINSGPSAIKVLQRASGAKVDGIIGPNTVESINSLSKDEILDARANMIKESGKIDSSLKKGLLNRVESFREDNTTNELPEADTEQAVEDAKKAIDRQIKQQGSGDMTPASHIDKTLETLENLPTDETTIEALQDEAVKIETFADAQRLKQLLETLKMS